MSIYDHLDELSDAEVRQLLIDLVDLQHRITDNKKKVTAELYRRIGNGEVVWTPHGQVPKR